MTFQSILMYVSSFFVLFFNFFTYFKNTKSKVNLSFAIFGVSIFIWLFVFGMAYNTTNASTKLYLFKVGYIGIIFIPITFYIFVRYTLEKKHRISVIIFNYIIGICFVVLNFSRFSLIDGMYEYPWGYYPKAALPLHLVFLLFFNSLFTYSIISLLLVFLRNDNKFNAIQRIRIKYIFLGSVFGSMGIIDYFPNYGIGLFPFGFIFMILYPIILTYAIVRYRLMEISIAITRTGVFVVTYSLILGIPFVIAYLLKSYLIGFFGEKWWLVPMGLLTVLATVGPFIYIYINSKAEERLLREQRQYQNTLRQASSGMIRVRELKRLLNLIVHVVTKTVKLEFASIFLFDAGNNQYAMAATRDGSNLQQNLVLKLNTPLIDKLHDKKEPLVYEEIQLQSQDSPHDLKLSALEKQIREIKAAVVIPSYVGNKLLGFIVLGKKLSGKIYSQDDLNVFSVLANQAALAIENAQFYEDIKETQEQLFQAEKMATVGTMADGLSHQINNRFQALSLISGDSLDILKTTDIVNCSNEVKDAFGQLKYAFERIQANVMQGGEIVRGLLKYSRPGETGFDAIDFNRVLDGATEMAQYKVRLQELELVRQIPQDLPKLKCNLTQLEEIFFNLLDNAYDAIKERQALLKDPSFKGKISISAEREDGNVRIIFVDNGIGVKDKDKEKLFTPFFTTKSTNRKGTGLGLYVIQKIVGFHEGTISIDSVYNSGTTFEIVLPLA